MNNDTTRRPREGVPSWIYAVSVGLSFLAVAAVIVRTTGLGQSRSGVILDGDRSSDAVLVADDDDQANVRASRAPGTRPQPIAILASRVDDRAATAPKAPLGVTTVDRAKRAIADCRDKYGEIHDYSCVFHKRERIDGRLTTPHIMTMKVRTRPESLYFKFAQPNRGREAIFIPDKNKGKIVAHDVGLGRLLAGTMILDPNGSMAMDENRHPITEAGIGALIRTIVDRWEAELTPEESLVTIHEHARVSDRACTMIESTHPARGAGFMFHKVKLFIDHENGLPIRFEAYDWPRTDGCEPELVEEYTYADLKTDIGLTDLDFDPANPRYSFGRF